jgi:putative selenium metabolism hydrolase
VPGAAEGRELLDFAAELVRIESYSSREEEAVRTVARRMEALGFDEVRIDSFGNVLGRIGSGGPSILFDSHLDTVEVNDAASWALPPFSGEIRDGSLWGRGSVDMKSGAAASIYAAVLAKRAGHAEGKTIFVSCTVLEEDCDGENLRHLFKEYGLRPDACVICEPSANAIALGHKGKAQILVRTRGVSAHGSAPEKGVNAVYEMAQIIQRVEAANLELSLRAAPRGTLVLSRISSTSVSLNAVPSACEIYLDRRMVLGETEETVRAEMDAIVAGKDASWEIGAISRRTWTGLDLRYEPFHLAWRIDPEEALYKATVRAYADTFGSAPGSFDFWDFSTNAVSTVREGIPTIGFGPGEYKLAHMRDERCPVGQIVDACAMYANLIKNL